LNAGEVTDVPAEGSCVKVIDGAVVTSVPLAGVVTTKFMVVALT
jgi:hypothetical protein